MGEMKNTFFLRKPLAEDTKVVFLSTGSRLIKRRDPDFLLNDENFYESFIFFAEAISSRDESKIEESLKNPAMSEVFVEGMERMEKEITALDKDYGQMGISFYEDQRREREEAEEERDFLAQFLDIAKENRPSRFGRVLKGLWRWISDGT
jgi:hypothetical protein